MRRWVVAYAGEPGGGALSPVWAGVLGVGPRFPAEEFAQARAAEEFAQARAEFDQARAEEEFAQVRAAEEIAQARAGWTGLPVGVTRGLPLGGSPGGSGSSLGYGPASSLPLPSSAPVRPVASSPPAVVRQLLGGGPRPVGQRMGVPRPPMRHGVSALPAGFVLPPGWSRGSADLDPSSYTFGQPQRVPYTVRSGRATQLVPADWRTGLPTPRFPAEEIAQDRAAGRGGYGQPVNREMFRTAQLAGLA